jgi:TRAP-type mannitol/chloroaromatic compound transport system permease large subunit
LLALIFSVLGVIYAGVATPTEASAIGALAATLMAVAYRKMSFGVLKDAARRTFQVTAMIAFTLIGSIMFQIIFLGLGGGDFFAEVVMAAPFGKWGTFAIMMLIIFFLGFFIVDLAIILIMVPLVTPVGAALGFDPLWFAMMVCMNIQISYLTPPFAQAIFFLKGAADPKLGITSGHIMRGVIPFVCLISLGMIVCIIFPQIITWLPSTMIK